MNVITDYGVRAAEVALHKALSKLLELNVMLLSIDTLTFKMFFADTE